MTCHDTPGTHDPKPSLSRMRHIENRLRADAEAMLREMAYVLKLTQRVKEEIETTRPRAPR